MPLPQGLNLVPPTYFADCPFVDRTRASGGWTGETTAEGWPAGKTTDIVYTRFPIATKPTEYDLIVRQGELFQGQEIAGNLPFKVLGNNRFSFVAQGNPAEGFTFRIRPAGTGPVKVAIAPANEVGLYDRGELFRPDFIDTIDGSYCLRFMDWGRVNKVLPARYPQFDDASWRDGVPTEVMAMLCNRVGAHMWWNAHHLMANDQIASSIGAAKLMPGLKLYVEASNEVGWNYGFPQSGWAQAQPGGAFFAYGVLAARVAIVMRDVNPNARMILCSQFVNPSLMKYILAGWDSTGAPRPLIEHYGIAPYITPRKPQMEQVQQLALAGDKEGFLNLLSLNQAANRKFLVQWGSLARQHGKGLVGYEHQLSLYPQTPEQTALYEAVAHSEEGAALVSRNLADFYAAGGLWANHFSSIGAGGKYGYWGLKPTYDGEGYPIYRHFIEGNMRGWKALARSGLT